MGLKVPTFYSRLDLSGSQPPSWTYPGTPFTSHLMSTRKTLISLEVPRVLGTLGQKPGKKINI